MTRKQASKKNPAKKKEKKLIKSPAIKTPDTSLLVWEHSLFTEEDIKNFQDGTHCKLYELFGNKQLTIENTTGTYFAVWAPNATAVHVTGNFNQWDGSIHLLHVRPDKSGIWEGFIPGIQAGEAYKYHITGLKGMALDKGDPFAHFWEKPPYTSSLTWGTYYEWEDKEWMKKRNEINNLNAPISIYEMHLASWMRPDKSNPELYNSYEQITEKLVPYIREMGFTHVEFMPVMEYPYDGSWGYQGIGYYAPTSRYGNPQDFAKMIDTLHRENIGVILDWVPSHFPSDAHGLYMFDGSCVYEYDDINKGYHPDWTSYIFNYGRGEVKSFLISSAYFWCDRFHADGLRVDAVSSMLRLDYSRNAGQWKPNKYGGNGNLEAIDFVKELNETMYRDFPDIQMIAEESTDWPKISKPTYDDGIGFGMKWMMGWMHDTLRYFKRDPIFRQFYQDDLTFSMMYFYGENFMLPFSHDEVVHGKSPMIYKMPGNDFQKFCNLRLLYAYFFTHPGTKLLFMGDEFGATNEWNYKSELQWDLLDLVSHGGLKYCVQKLNELYRNEPALYEKQFYPEGFEWIDISKPETCVISYRRKGVLPENDLVIILNLTETIHENWMLQLSGKKTWKEIFNSDSIEFWGSGKITNKDIEVVLIDPEVSNATTEEAEKVDEEIIQDNKQEIYNVTIHLPGLSAIILK
ncbi:MAG: 1,4-alpha-glucan branching protein GlgB [Bacteroidetes bacterium]|nr:1,4-alpha-glucan branching protein GlgB [Bacteroidota bacterium]